MFDRFIRLARARKALREARYFDALQQVSDPLIEHDRRADDIRERATAELLRRAQRRLEAGELATARAEVRRIGQLVRGEAVADLLQRIESAVDGREREDAEGRQGRAEFRRLLDSGDLAAAQALVASLPGTGGAGNASLLEAVEARRREAREGLERAEQAARVGDLDGAADAFQRALTFDRAPTATLRSAAMRSIAQAVPANVESAGRADRCGGDELVAALQRYGRLRRRVPEMIEQAPVRELEQRLLAGCQRELRQCRTLADAAVFADEAQACGLPLGPFDDVCTALLAQGGEARSSARVAALTKLREAAERCDLARLRSLADVAIATHSAGERELMDARELLEKGELEAARAMFVAFLEAHPMHDGVQQELEMVDASLADLDRRLADLRLALRAGRLREACREAITLVGSARVAAEAQQILAEARSRMALVDRGLDEVRVALHGRAAATRQGVAHCLKRLQELQKVQVDHPELETMVAAVSCEIEAIERCERVGPALDAADLGAVTSELAALLEMRSGLLGPERIDARLCVIGDAISQRGDEALEDGRLVPVQRCVALLERLAVVRDDFATRARAWRIEAERREAEVQRHLQAARGHLERRDLSEAEREVEAAGRLWRESAEVQSFAHRLATLRRQTEALEHVATMTDERDFLGAQEKLASLPGVSPMLRTRVYDIKQGLARAQGLDGPFLLRVDEGGEQLVVRSESVSLGNLRQARADLPLLANLSARHASIRRRMSFHGGMQDAVVAEDGEVRVGGEVVAERVLADGDRVQLGSSLSLVYRRPCSRSLSSRLTLQGGFQVAGTDRVLLMKDRGRDGRIVIGAGRDVHVAVPRATGEVEVFADNSGKMKVACDQGGTIDGQVFRGAHPVAAGQVVEAVGVTFVLMPWHAQG